MCRTYGHAIDGCQAHYVKVTDCYIHDLPGAGIHMAGGSTIGYFARNFIENVGFGMNIGFATEFEYMDWFNNPELYENINSTVVNNIISHSQACAFHLFSSECLDYLHICLLPQNSGINLWAAQNAVVAFNSIWQAQQTAQAGVLLNSYTHADAPGSPTIGCFNIELKNNILVKSANSTHGPVFQVWLFIQSSRAKFLVNRFAS